MNDEATHDDTGQQLALLKDKLLGQMSMLREDRLDELLSSLHDTSRLLEHLQQAQVPPELSQELQDIRTLHGQLGLSLAAELSDTQTRLSHLGKGRRVLRAYRM